MQQTLSTLPQDCGPSEPLRKALLRNVKRAKTHNRYFLTFKALVEVVDAGLTSFQDDTYQIGNDHVHVMLSVREASRIHASETLRVHSGGHAAGYQSRFDMTRHGATATFGRVCCN